MYICNTQLTRKEVVMLTLEDCKTRLALFKQQLGPIFGIKRLGIFGSVARDEQRDDSDIDIVVDLERPTLAGMYDLRERLSALFHCRVDLVRYRDTLRPSFKQHLLNDVIYV